MMIKHQTLSDLRRLRDQLVFDIRSLDRAIQLMETEAKKVEQKAEALGPDEGEGRGE